MILITGATGNNGTEILKRLPTGDVQTVTGLADRLQGWGLIERVVNPANRRSNTLVLTPKGVKVRRRLVEAMSTRSPIARLSAVEQRQLHHLLSKAMSTADGSGAGSYPE